jgi:riboflavin transporter FmnP
MSKTIRGYFTPSMIAKIGIFSALSYALYMLPLLLPIKLPIFPVFLELHFSDMPALICGFVCGPVAGSVVIAVKTILKLPFTSTFCVGELTDLIIGVTFTVIPSLIYKRRKTMRAAAVGLAAGMAASVGVALAINYFFIIRLYVILFFGGSFEPLLGMVRPFAEGIDENNFYALYIPYIALPFNLLRSAVSAVFTFLVFKRVGAMLDKLFVKE